jgi:hypothetical protein
MSGWCVNQQMAQVPAVVTIEALRAAEFVTLIYRCLAARGIAKKQEMYHVSTITHAAT